MITKKTVLVLGAGASRDYGFPTGSELRIQILDGLSSPDEGLASEIMELYPSIKYKKLAKFRKDFSGSGAYTIDEFLEHRKDHWELGRLIVALIIIRCEREMNVEPDPHNERWYEYLLHRMNAPPNEFKQNNLSIVTFNYDRSFECFFLDALKRRYASFSFPPVPVDTDALFDSIPLVHVHGELHGLLAVSTQPADLTPEAVSSCAHTLKIPFEDIENSDAFLKARRWIAESEVICFLGIGYHRMNLLRLGLHPNAEHLRLSRILGTAYGLDQYIRREVNSYFQIEGEPLIHLGRPEEDVLTFLKNYEVLD